MTVNQALGVSVPSSSGNISYGLESWIPQNYDSSSFCPSDTSSRAPRMHLNTQNASEYPECIWMGDRCTLVPIVVHKAFPCHDFINDEVVTWNPVMHYKPFVWRIHWSEVLFHTKASNAEFCNVFLLLLEQGDHQCVNPLCPVTSLILRKCLTFVQVGMNCCLMALNPIT